MPTAPGPRANIVCVGGSRAPRKHSLRGWIPGGGGVAQSATGGGELSPEALAKGKTQVTSN